MPTLVLLPGMDGTGDLFAPFLEALGDQFKTQVVRYPTDQELGYDELLALTRRFLPIDEPYIVLGESFSGHIAISLAAEAPPLLRGLILCCTFVRNPRPALEPLKSLLPFVPLHWSPSAALGWALLGSFGSIALRAAIAGAVRRVAPKVLRARLRSVASVDVSAMLATVKVPCLYLRASRDRMVPASASVHIQDVLPLVSVVQINAPHCLLQAEPAQAARVVSSFVSEVQGAL
ncbi:alpha/beta fold hydrolase [Undibacterium fentianense]|uniref:Alpha/beta hydrolase n=1 Tax=Undibacterium fentianense TaxID=2828728 RepID=A0A941E0D7_9BURK|nr:alpha/beta hydrolase [Undibacterium fentianense]MBR7800110.1 alpha/beta hydrolase [Undibacterium fentianense]